MDIYWVKCDRAWIGVRQRYKSLLNDYILRLFRNDDNFVYEFSVSLFRVMRYLEENDIPYDISTVEPCKNPIKVYLPLSVLIKDGHDECLRKVCALLGYDKTGVEIHPL